MKRKKLNVLIDTFEGYIDVFNKYNHSGIQTFIRSFMHNYSNIMDWIDTPYICYFNKNDYYSNNYLLDLMLATKYSDDDFVGKKTHYILSDGKLEELNSGREYELVNGLNVSSTIAKTSAYTGLSLEDVLAHFENEADLFKFFLSTEKRSIVMTNLII